MQIPVTYGEQQNNQRIKHFFLTPSFLGEGYLTRILIRHNVAFSSIFAVNDVLCLNGEVCL